jgi:hypothetical protein
MTLPNNRSTLGSNKTGEDYVHTSDISAARHLRKQVYFIIHPHFSLGLAMEPSRQKRVVAYLTYQTLVREEE